MPEAPQHPGFTKRVALGWQVWRDARILPYQVSKDDLSANLALVDTGPDPHWQGVPLDFILRRLRRSLKHPILMRDRRCLRHGLLGFRYLRKAGFDPVLKFALVSDSVKSANIDAHCWVCLDGTPVISDRDDGMIEMMEFPQVAAV